MEKYFIYNLGFPEGVNELVISNYRFKKINPDTNNIEPQFPIGHQATSVVEIPFYEHNTILAWSDKEIKHLEDILLLLSILNGKEVFKAHDIDDTFVSRVYDSRQHEWGYELMLSLEPELIWKHKDTGEVSYNAELMDNSDYIQIDIGFEKGINEIIKLLASKEWQEQYKGGHFLFLYQQAIRKQPVDSSFIICWTIWEHIFTIHNQNCLDENAIEKLSGYEKIAFILNKYFLIKFDKKTKESIRKLAKTRNRIIHYGKFTEDITIHEMVMFIGITERLIAIILGLKPSNAFNSMEALEDFLKHQFVQEQNKRSLISW